MDQKYWQNRYLNEDIGWNIGAVSSPIEQYCDQLTDKTLKILIPGAGYGHEAAYLHRLGFAEVYVLDFVPEALSHFELLNPDFPKEHLLCEDFFNHTGRYDLILEQTLFCAIDPSKRRDYVQQVHRLLKPGGKLTGVLFNKEFEGGPPFGGNVAEYQELFGPFFRIRTMETCYNSIAPRAGSEVFILFENLRI